MGAFSPRAADALGRVGPKPPLGHEKAEELLQGLPVDIDRPRGHFVLAEFQDELHQDLLGDLHRPGPGVSAIQPAPEGPQLLGVDLDGAPPQPRQGGGRTRPGGG